MSWLLRLGTAVLAVQRGAVSVSPDGTPLTFSKGPVTLDLGSMPLGLFPALGPAVPTVSTLELLGSQGSFLEGEALDQVFAGDHVTGVTFLTRAVRESQTLTRVDAANVVEALAAAELSAEAEASVEAGVGRGWVGWIPESQLLVDTFDATGYVVEDPATGAAGYFVTYERLVEGGEDLTTSYTYDSANRLTSVTDPAARVYGYAFSPAGLQTSLIHPNGIETSYSHDAARRLSALVTKTVADEIVQSYFFGFRLDYISYETNPPSFGPHCHLAYGSSEYASMDIHYPWCQF